MDVDQACRNAHAPWSVIVSATLNANLATVLAGFTITAIAFLLGRKRSEEKALHAVALFAPGVLVLALASNLFGSIAAIAPPVRNGQVPPDGQYVCGVALTQSQAANGMLGVGFVIMVAGLSWTMAHAADADTRDRKSLVHLGNSLVLIAIVTVSLLLTRNSLNYVARMHEFGVHLPGQLDAALWSIFGFIAVVSAVIIGIRMLRYYRGLAAGRPLADEETVMARRLRRIPFVSVIVLTAPMAFFGSLCCIVTGQETSTPGGLAAFFALAVGVFLPYLIFLLIASSVPGPGFFYWAPAKSEK